MISNIRISSTGDGLELNNSIISFDSYHNKNVSFISSIVSPYMKVSASVIATKEIFELLKSFGRLPNGLSCEYQKQITVGRLKMKLLPSGVSLGGASLLVEFPNHTLLYAPYLRAKRVLNFRSMVLKAADELVLGAFYMESSSSNYKRHQEVERFLDKVERDVKSGAYPSVICPPIDLAQELTARLIERNIPVNVHPAIARINKVYDKFGFSLGSSAPLSSSEPSVGFYPLSKSIRRYRKPCFRSSPSYLIQNSLESNNKLLGAPFSDSFFVSPYSSLKELKLEIVNNVKPKKIVVFGPYTKQYVEELKSIAKSVEPLYQNNQPHLF